MSRRTLKHLRQQILQSRGLEPKRYNKPQPASIPDPKPGYTKEMLLAEKIIGIPLAEILFTQPAWKLAQIFKVNRWTIYRWRNRLNGR